MPSSGGTILVTGANGGLGSAIVAHILKEPHLASDYTAVYTVRNEQAASRLRSVLAKAPAAHKHEMLELELGSVESVKRTAAEVNRRVAAGELPPIRALILNAGYQDATAMTISDDGLEMSWQVNFLANLVLSLQLLQSMRKDDGRILLMGSWAHDIEDERNAMGGSNHLYKPPQFETLFPGPEALAKGRWSTPQDDPSWYGGHRRYGASKLCTVMLMHELANRLAKDPELSNIAVIGLDPGGMGSDISRRGSFMMSVVTMKVVLPLLAAILVRFYPNGAIRPLWKSASDVVGACFEVETPKGKFLYLNGSEEWETAKDAQDEDKRRALWQYGLEAAGIKAGDTVLADWQ
ncbi:hypothetical protein CDD83_9489 [Cordyceps sp. RAO-2017]|nr:hypothetical protein CDD83_9489 [Cordyceps sp. RAO-2017]